MFARSTPPPPSAKNDSSCDPNHPYCALETTSVADEHYSPCPGYADQNRSDVARSTAAKSITRDQVIRCLDTPEVRALR
jgi:hypothetical protein